MPEMNWLAIIVAGLIPSILGAIYYGPLFEKQWLSSLGKTKEEMVPSNMGLTYGLAMLVAMWLSLNIKMIIEVSHKVTNAAGEMVFQSDHNFGHGALHGGLICLAVVVPIIISLGLFQKNSGKNILLNIVFWMISCALMGGIVDAWT